VIAKLAIDDSSATPIKWWPKVKALVNIKELDFAPGLNILWGRNGSGKSTVLRLIARMFHAEQGRFSTITQTSIDKLLGYGAKSTPRNGAKFRHDGQGVAYYDPGATPGLIGGSFDDDFMMTGVSSIFTKGSSGQLVINEVAKILSKFKDKTSVAPVWKIKKNKWNTKRLESIEEFFKPSIEPSKPTLLFDEPDRSIDLPNQVTMWRGFPNLAHKYQLLIATHSPLAANIEGANYIQLSDGYLDECRSVLKGLVK